VSVELSTEALHEQIRELRDAVAFNMNSTHAGIRSEARITFRLCGYALDPDHQHHAESRRECAKLIAARARAV
jgi:hypothetical protein